MFPAHVWQREKRSIIPCLGSIKPPNFGRPPSIISEYLMPPSVVTDICFCRKNKNSVNRVHLGHLPPTIKPETHKGLKHVRECLHDTGATFAPKQVHSGSLSQLYICLHDTTTKCHAGAGHPSVNSLRFLYQGENFIPVRNLARVLCKHKTTTCFGVKSVCW